MNHFNLRIKVSRWCRRSAGEARIGVISQGRHNGENQLRGRRALYSRASPRYQTQKPAANRGSGSGIYIQILLGLG